MAGRRLRASPVGIGCRHACVYTCVRVVRDGSGLLVLCAVSTSCCLYARCLTGARSPRANGIAKSQRGVLTDGPSCMYTARQVACFTRGSVWELWVHARLLDTAAILHKASCPRGGTIQPPPPGRLKFSFLACRSLMRPNWLCACQRVKHWQKNCVKQACGKLCACMKQAPGDGCVPC